MHKLFHYGLHRAVHSKRLRKEKKKKKKNKVMSHGLIFFSCIKNIKKVKI